ncbi:putative carbonic anhydrase 3 [Anopheles maculipalpis]|uniref:putative carbonic anhydrase 3 n=1 Tax=Anopheles maculipalpis TaxID=1496333 RepID=UPI0021594C4E|nr:putative carbonic anhydrase 3 [Anopheles maculipalpis]
MSQTSIRSDADDPPPARQSSSTISLENEALVWSLASTEAYQPAPIDINVGRSEQIELPALRWNNYESLPASIKLTNTGDTAILSARWNGETPSLEGGALDGRYLFSQLHFHWGRTALDGSEHTVDGYRLPLEMHVIHFAERFGDQDAALAVPGGVLCLVYFFHLKSNPNRFLAPVVNGLSQTVLPESYTKLEPFPLMNLFHAFVDEYFLYWGCTRNGPQVSPMLWMLSRTQEPLDFHQLKQFNRLLDRRMRPHYNLKPSNTEPSTGRHLFHVNPRTPMAVSTLMIEPPSKFSHSRWIVDRHPVDWSSPEACRQYVAMVREHLAQKQNDHDEMVQCPENESATNSEY